jgi:hypothetical protein
MALALFALSFASSALCEQTQPTLTLHPASSTVRLTGPTAVPLPPAANKYTLDLAYGEREAFQVLVRRDLPEEAQSTVPLEVTVQASLLSAAASKTEVRCYQILDVNYTSPADNPTFKIPVRNTGWIPDVCLPTEKATASDRDPNLVTFLFDIGGLRTLTPPTSITFSFNLEFTSPGLSPVTLKLKVVVHPTVIPTTLPFKTSVTWNWGIEKYLGRDLTPKERLAYLDFFLDYRFTPASFFTRGLAFSPDEIKHIVERGGNVFQIFHIGGGGKRLLSDKDKEAAKPQIEECRKVLEGAGALQYACALIADEPADDTSDTIRANATWLKSVFPELKIWVATRPRKELLDVVDIWDPITAHSTDIYAKHSFTAESYQLARSAPNKPEMWWFFSVEPYAPHPNCRIDDNLVDSRYIGWLSYLQGMNGFEYFWATDWEANAPLRDVPYPEKAAKWNLGLAGAGQLCYPGNDGLPIPSLRLINLRDAMEDWALFFTAGPAMKEPAPKDARSPEASARLREIAFGLIEQK